MERRSVIDDEMHRSTARNSLGSTRDARETEENLIDLLQETAINMLRATGQVTLEAVKVTRDVIKGTLEAGEDVGTDVADSARSLARATIGGAIDTAGVLGNSAVNTASTILAGMVTGLRQVTRAATGDRQPTYHRQPAYNRASSFEDITDPAAAGFPENSAADMETDMYATTGPLRTGKEKDPNDPHIVRGY